MNIHSAPQPRDDIEIGRGQRRHLREVDSLESKRQERLNKLLNPGDPASARSPISQSMARLLLNTLEGLNTPTANISNGGSTVNTANIGLSSMKSLMSHMEGIAYVASSEGTSDSEKKALAADYDILREQVTKIANDSSFNGDNVVINQPDYSMPVEFNAKGTTALNVNRVFDNGPTVLTDKASGKQYTVSPDGKSLQGKEVISTEKPVPSGKSPTTDKPAPEGKTVSASGKPSVTPTPPDSMEIIFVVDTTGSMYGDIKAVRDGVEGFVKELESSPHVDSWKAKVVGYKDYNLDKGSYYRDADFVSSTAELEDQLNVLLSDVRGGGDTPESLADSIHEAVETTVWSNEPNVGKAIAVFTDAPSLTPKKAGISAAKIGENVKENGIDLRILTDRPDDKVTSELANAAGATVEKLGHGKADITKSLKDIAKSVKFYPEHRNTIETGSNSGKIDINYDMRKISDKLAVYHDGNKIYEESLSGSGTVSLNYSGSSDKIEIVVNEGGTSKSDNWNYSVRVKGDTPTTPPPPETNTKTVNQVKDTVISGGSISSNGINKDGDISLNINGETREFKVEGGIGLLPSFAFNGFRNPGDFNSVQKNLNSVRSKIDSGMYRFNMNQHVLDVREAFTQTKSNIIEEGISKLTNYDPLRNMLEARVLGDRKGIALNQVKSYADIANFTAQNLLGRR